jgi:membrane-bound lytic murein transglycosylase D
MKKKELMKKVFIAMTVFGSMFMSVYAQDVQDVQDVEVEDAQHVQEMTVSEEPDTIVSEEPEVPVVEDDSIYIPESLESDVDSLLRSWHVNYHTDRNGDCIEFERDISPSDSICMHRLKVLPKIIEMPYNEPVKRSIQLYTEKRRTLVQYMLGLADYYFPSIEQILDEYGLPLELKYLVVVESALNPTALSRAGASGLWQFMLPTGKIYGLEINSLVDERRDPVKATYAACRYLKDMYAIYGDWNLVIAAYNCGPGNVNKAIRRAKGQKDYWAIYRYLPRETRSYLPLFIGATYVMNYYKEHNICPVSTTMPLSNDTVTINRLLHLEQVAQMLKVDIEQLRAINPEFKKDIIPGNYKPYTLRLPTALMSVFIELEEEIYAYNTEQYFPNRDYAGPAVTSLAGKASKVVHRVAKGESMPVIANNYGVSVSQIKKWNGLRSSRVSPGKRLTLYVYNGGYSANTVESATSYRAGKEITSKSTAGKSSDDASYQRYKVRKGDSFYTIARKYPGVDAKGLMRFNNIRDPILKVGQIIRIPAG